MKIGNQSNIDRVRLFIRYTFLILAAGASHLLTNGVVFATQSPSLAGITEPISDVTLSLSVSGIVSKIFVKEGDRVRKDQLVLNLDKRAEELEVARRKLVWESKAEEEGARARARTLKEIYESTLKLYESTKSVSEEDLKKSELEYKLAVFEKDRLSAAELREKIEYEAAVEALEKRLLRSPIGGTVIKIAYDEGESCEEHQPLARIVDTSRGRFVCNLEEGLGRLIERGREVVLTIGAGQIEKKDKVSFVSPVVDSASGLMEVKVEFDNRDGRVSPGAAATMTFDFQ